MSRATERYLRQATRGLSRPARVAVQAELTSHIHERLHQHQAFGLSPEAAEARVLAELGAPARVNRGLLRVHTLSWLAPLGALGMLGVTLIISLPHGLAQVQGPDPSAPPNSVQYVEVDSLKAELQRAGVTVDGPVSRWTLTFPGGRRPVTLTPTRPGEGAATAPGTSLVPTLYQDEVRHRTYLDANLLIDAAGEAGLPVRLDGWKNPRLHLGDVTLQLGTEAAPTDAYNIYARFIGWITQQVAGGQHTSYLGNFRWNPLAIRSRYVLKTGRSGEVYSLITTHQQGTSLVFDFDVAPVDSEGTLVFNLPYGLDRLQLVPTLTAFKAGQSLSHGRPPAALLLRLNNDSRMGIPYTVQPANQILENLSE